MKKMLQIALVATFFVACASTSSSSDSKIHNKLVQNKLFKIEKIIVKGKTFVPLNLKLIEFVFEIMTHYF